MLSIRGVKWAGLLVAVMMVMMMMSGVALAAPAQQQGCDGALSALSNPQGPWVGPQTVSAALTGCGAASVPTTGGIAAAALVPAPASSMCPAAQAALENPNGYWIGPETVGAALAGC